ISEAGGLTSIAHPVRIPAKRPGELPRMVGEMRDDGLHAIEAYHSDHKPQLTAEYLELARELGLGVTGGSDFHGEAKPGIRLGVGPGHLNVPRSVLDALR
ncbi:MAG: PHP domain-containing protein, partial [Bryobacteraceae bacterium]